MNINQNAAVFTCMDSNQEKNLIEDFLKTLRNVACFKGKVIIMDYGMSEQAVNRINNEFSNVEVVKCSKDRHIFSVRFRDMAEIIKNLPSDITHIMSIDSGDIWFQSSITELFELCETKIGYVEDYSLDDSLWNRQLLSMLRPQEMNKLRKNLLGTRQKNAGMICGPRELMEYVSAAISGYVLEYGLDFFGLDQLYFNYIINNMDAENKIVLPKKYNYVLIDTRCKHIIENNTVYDEKHDLVAVVHNAGGGSNRVIKKEYSEDADEMQYKRVIQIYK
jgi:hypothetical protein